MGKGSANNPRERPTKGQVTALAARSSAPSDQPPRSRTRDSIPSEWLDQLFHASLDLPLASGERDVVKGMVALLSGILPAHIVGACFVSDPAKGERERIVMGPLGARLEPGKPDDRRRMFPSSSREHVAHIPCGAYGSTLHVASDEDALDGDSSPAAHLANRAALILGSLLAHAREIASRQAEGNRQALEERMLQADKLATFGQVAANLVHELNNPLTSIVAYSEYLVRKALSFGSGVATFDAEDVERLRRIGESGTRMLRFTRDVMSYARPSSGVVGPVALHEIIDQAIAFCDHVLSAARTRVERRYAADVLTVRGVSDNLVQVFVNLLTNASHAAPAEGGSVAVETRLDAAARRIVIRIEDNGSGIAPEHLSLVFEPFFTTKSESHGTGLGLSIVKSIVLAHEGEIHVDSYPGRGTRFFIALPVA